METKTSGEYLEQIGWGRYNTKVFIQCGMAWLADMLWSNNVAYVLSGSKDSFNLTSSQMGALGAAFPFGLMIGAFMWGIIADRYGRMYAFKTTVVIATIFSFILIFSPHVGMTAVCLFFLGVGMGGELSLGGTVFCEFCPPSRLYYLTIMSIFWAFGGTISALIALIVVLTNNSGIADWRFIVGSSFVIEFFSLLFRFFLEETPAFCQETGQLDRMEAVLKNIAVENTQTDIEIDVKSGVLETTARVTEEPEELSTWFILRRLFASRTNFKNVLIFALMYSSAAFAYTSMLFFMPEFLSDLGTVGAYGVILLQQFLGIPGTLFGTWLVETRLGRKYTITFSFGLAGICCFLFYIQKNAYSIIVNTSIMNLVAIMGYSAIYTVTPESYSTDVRNIGVGMANISARVSGVICPIFTGWLLSQSGGFEIALAIFACLFAVCALSALPLKETRQNPNAAVKEEKGNESKKVDEDEGKSHEYIKNAGFQYTVEETEGKHPKGEGKTKDLKFELDGTEKNHKNHDKINGAKEHVEENGHESHSSRAKSGSKCRSPAENEEKAEPGEEKEVKS